MQRNRYATKDVCKVCKGMKRGMQRYGKKYV